jgi:endonuclease III
MQKQAMDSTESHDAETAPSTSAFIYEIDRRLSLYGTSRHGNLEDPLAELVFIILSAQTEAYSYLQTFDDLRKHYPSWQSLLDATVEEVEVVIRRGGLAHKKAVQLLGSLHKIVTDFGELSLDQLRHLDDQSLRRYLISLPGIGNKSASCIMMYSLDRQVFPVDTHVWRVCRRLGLTPPIPKPTPALERILEKAIPSNVRYSLHVNLLSHGQQTCTTYWPKCGNCVLADICPSRDKPDEVWGKWRRPGGVWAKALDGKGSSKDK